MSSSKTRTASPSRSKNPPRRRRWIPWAASSVAVVIIIAVLYAVFTSSAAAPAKGAGGPAGSVAFEVGDPGPGRPAPAFTLTDGTGAKVSLSDYRGKNVLLFFQEGLTCQACWQQLTALEQAQGRVSAAGVDAVLSISADQADLLGRAAKDMGISTPVLSDPGLVASAAYGTNRYGMMGDSRNGHSFILVGPDGTIRWRADYGGAPNYTMFVPVATLLADLQQRTQQ